MPLTTITTTIDFLRLNKGERKFNTFLLAFDYFKNTTKYKITDKVSVQIPYRLILLLLRCLEVVYRLYSTDYLCGRLDILNYLIHILIRHRRFVECVGHYAS